VHNPDIFSCSGGLGPSVDLPSGSPRWLSAGAAPAAFLPFPKSFRPPRLAEGLVRGPSTPLRSTQDDISNKGLTPHCRCLEVDGYRCSRGTSELNQIIVSESHSRLGPPRKIRLVWWVTIFLVGSFWLKWSIPVFPMALGLEYSLYYSDSRDNFIKIYSFAFGYAVYGIHLWLTLRAKTRREFLLMILSLILLVLATIWSALASNAFHGL
jgi:hypothetical protein